MFDDERFIEDCLAALREKTPHAAVKEIVARAVAEPRHVLKALGEPKLAGIEPLYRSEQLTILNVRWGPGMNLYPHDHRMWAVIGVYGGQEENAFFRRGPAKLLEHGNKTLRTKDTLPLGESVIHAVTNPLDKITAAIHVYGGDFFAVPRSEWDPQTLEERPFDLEHAKRVFEKSNQRLPAAKVGIAG
jgi:predicted metal-dependent enzyme (double-stranded beta helix superfamily)